MSEYRRAFAPGGMFFFAVVTANRAPIFADHANAQLLHDAIAAYGKIKPFQTVAMVLLPDHLHAIWKLPKSDADFSSRWKAIKSHFTRAYLQQGRFQNRVTESQFLRGNRGVWQRRFWEHLLRDEDDLRRHMDYIHYNPVKHGLAKCPHEWGQSTFHRLVVANQYDREWCCNCTQPIRPPDFSWAEQFDME